MTTTIDEAKGLLEDATARYRKVEEALAESVAGETTPERVLRHVELRGALHDAAQGLIAAKQSFEAIVTETSDRRRERAQADLVAAEEQLVEVVADAERDIEKLTKSLERVLDVSKKRYAFRQEATGRASRTMLARNAIVGWIQYRVRDLELPDFESPRHYRADLAGLLGLEMPATDIDKAEEAS